MVNVGTGNMLLQDDDMAVPHKGISLTFRRTYNSQSQHDTAGTDGAVPSMYGNGWTNTFDAHLSGSRTGTISVWDIDGARYDYTLAADGVTMVPPPGQHATLTSDGATGYFWTKKSGTTYYFWAPDGATAWPSSVYQQYGAYAGRLYQIIGRNRYTYLTFTYTWDNANAAAGGKISAIAAQTESGSTATLAFGDVGGRRLMSSITFPDGATTVSYAYDAYGNLIIVSRPPNNRAGTRLSHSYGYQTLGTYTVMAWADSPRWESCASGCGSDGAWLQFGFTGTSASLALSTIGYGGVVNPSIPDGSNSTTLQSGYPTTAVWYLTEYFTTGTSMPTLRDSDGHATNWVVDSRGRPTQTQECTATTGSSCGMSLVSNETWDSDNNLATETDPRNNETYYLYDPRGNTTVVAGPYTTTSQGSFLPTKIYDYDANNNVVAYCDENEAHQAGVDYQPVSFSISSNDSLCSSQMGSVPYWHATYINPNWELAGELTSVTTPLGYTRTFSYAASQQTGYDYGLPTAVTGSAITQLDGSTITPTQRFWYDSSGNLACYSKGRGISVLSYDALGRMTSVADPDDSSANASSLCGKTAGQPGWNTQTTYTHFPNGAVWTSQTPGERAIGVSTAYTYDLDSNPITETHHHGCSSSSSCTPGTRTKWYDGADRLVEVIEPHDSSDVYSFAWMTRYLYDLTQGNSVSGGGTTYRAYGNLFRTQKYAFDGTDSIPISPAGPPQESHPAQWIDVSGDAYDALDRSLAHYSYLAGRLATTSSAYDQTSGTLGLMSAKTKADGAIETFGYDSRGLVVLAQFSNNTPAYSQQYDANGQVVSINQADVGTQQYTYDSDGRIATSTEPPGGAVALSSPTTLIYSYYGSGERSAISVSSSALSQQNLVTYSYRDDGLARTTVLNNGTPYSFAKTYTDGGRFLAQSDPYAVNVLTEAYDSYGRTNAYSLPSGAFSAFQRDAEDNVQAFTAGGTTSTQTYTVRGELVGQVMSSAAGWWPAEDAHMALGALVDMAKIPTDNCGYSTDDYGTQMQACGNWFANIDVRSGASLGTSWVFTNGFGKTCAVAPGDPCALQGSSVNYDFNGRDIGSRVPLWNTTTQHFTYDFDDHILSANSSAYMASYNWGPNGHPIRTAADFVDYNGNHGPTAYRTLHWDGDDLLFETNGSGQLEQLRLPAIADIFPITGSYHGLNVWDRDFAGYIAGVHNSTGHSGLTIRTASTPCQGSVTSAASTGFVGGVLPPTGCGQDHPGIFGQFRLDGLNDGQTTIQGVRTYNDGTGTWTSPDAYAGTIHDPASQMPYMWNRNNPYRYSDPSGFCSVMQGVQTVQNYAGKTVQASGIGCVTARPYLPPQSAARALERFNAPGSTPRFHAPNLMSTATSLILAAKPNPVEMHHWLPRQFGNFFQSKGIDIEEYTSKLRRDAHRGAGTGLHTAGKWNERWGAWIEENRAASARDVIDQLNRMSSDYGIMFDNPF